MQGFRLARHSQLEELLVDRDVMPAILASKS
jgi:hypothetical protein